MTERLLQFIWQFQYFHAAELQTTAGDTIQVVHPGQWNSNQGPDFNNARLRIAGQMWAGNVELHIRASDWHRHAHHKDNNYTNIILHVVWANDDTRLSAGIPTLVLEDRISNLLLQQYESWMHSHSFIPCGSYLSPVSDLNWTSWKERLLTERMQRRFVQIRLMLDANKDHWEETLWWTLARNFGLPVNAGAFEEMARSVPFTLLNRHRSQIHQLESLLLGQAGLLGGDHDDQYFLMLRKEYQFYRAKYGLRQIHSPVHFLRMRPPSFPTVRLAQLAMLLHRSANLLSSVLEAERVKDLKLLLRTTANDYWHYHYTFEQVSAFEPKTLGEQMIGNIIINTMAPLVFAYGCDHRAEKYMMRAMDWLAEMKAENNAIVREFAVLGIKSSDAAASQALIELKTQYCDQRRCLDCTIGHAILGFTHKR